jgi:hypothetical protein
LPTETWSSLLGGGGRKEGGRKEEGRRKEGRRRK